MFQRGRQRNETSRSGRKPNQGDHRTGLQRRHHPFGIRQQHENHLVAGRPDRGDDSRKTRRQHDLCHPGTGALLRRDIHAGRRHQTGKRHFLRLLSAYRERLLHDGRSGTIFGTSGRTDL